jgi:hypothetical protein
MSMDLAAFEIDPSAAMRSSRSALPGPKARSPFVMTRAVILMAADMDGLSLDRRSMAHGENDASDSRRNSGS